MLSSNEELRKRSESLSRTLTVSWWIGTFVCSLSFGMEFHSAWVTLGIIGGAFALQAIVAQALFVGADL